MGITGLLPFLKNASRPASLDEFSGKIAAVDVYVWLHRGAFGCADKLVMGEKTNGYVLYAMRLIDLLLHYNVKPILVFDGRNLPSKARTEAKRRENRANYRKMAKDYLNEGKHREAIECFQRAIDVTPAMARDLIQACRERNIDCIVAPYEADAQLAFLIREGIADLVISEDSDLTLFGCQKILFKMDKQGNGVLYDKDRLPECLGNRATSFDLTKFRYMCIMAGCDYLESLPGIGLGKALKFWGKVTQPSLELALLKIPAYLNMPKLKISEEYINGFIQANLTFLYQIVYDPKMRKMKPLTPYAKNEEEIDLSFAGDILTDDQQAFDFAIGNLNIGGKKLEKVTSYDPENAPATENPCYGKRAPHISIWDTKSAQIEQNKKSIEQANQKIKSCFSEAPQKITLNAKQKIASNAHIKSNSQDDQPIWYISKYFKTNIPKDKTNDVLVENINNTAKDTTKEDDSEEILTVYKERPEKLIQTPPRTTSAEIVSYSLPLNHSETLLDDDAENISDNVRRNISSQKKDHILKFSPNNSCINKGRRKSKEDSGDWLEQLDSDTALQDVKVIYNTLSIESKDCEKSMGDESNVNGLKQVPSPLPQYHHSSSVAARKAFKPVACNQVECDNNPSTLDCAVSNDRFDDASLEKTRKRNPFAKVLISTPKAKHNNSSPKEESKETLSSDPNVIIPSPCKVTSIRNFEKSSHDIPKNCESYDESETPSQALPSKLPSSKKLSSLYSSPTVSESISSKKPRFSFPSQSTEASSCYFKTGTSSPAIASKNENKGFVKTRVSGLLKKKSTQPNLLQMWAKNN